jgi:hypothetical protein
MGSTSFLATDGYASTRWGTLADRSMPLWAVFYDFNVSLDFLPAFIPNGIGIAGLAFLVIYIINRKNVKDKFVITLLAVSGIFLFMTTKLFPWNIFQELAGVIQFPWRFLIFPTFFIAIAVAVYFSKKQTKTREMTLSLVIVLALSLYSFISCFAPYFNVYLNYKQNNKSISYSYTNNIGAAEYLPTTDEFKKDSKYDANYKAALKKNANTIFSDGKPKATLERVDGKMIVKFSGIQKDNAYISVPLVMYKGYTATLDDGRELECTYGSYNRIKVNLGDVKEGTIVFEYTGTAIQHTSRIISIAALVLLVLFIAWERFNYFANKKKEYVAPEFECKKKYDPPALNNSNKK